MLERRSILGSPSRAWQSAGKRWKEALQDAARFFKLGGNSLTRKTAPGPDSLTGKVSVSYVTLERCRRNSLCPPAIALVALHVLVKTSCKNTLRKEWGT